MHPEHQLTMQNDPNNLARQQQNALRTIGSYVGRAVSTVAVGVAVRYYKNKNKPATKEDQEPLTGLSWLFNEFKEEAAVTAATVLAWNAHVGGETGANACEYAADRLNRISEQATILPPYAAPRTTLLASNAADNLLWRYATQAANSFADTFGQPATQQPAPQMPGLPRFF